MSGNILGNHLVVSTSLQPTDAYISHLSHLAHPRIAKDLLCDIHKQSSSQANAYVKPFSAAIAQALEFHNGCKQSPPKIKPVYQYYSYLNLAVALILAYRPKNFEQFKTHGVEDKSYPLTKLELSSPILRVRPKGAAPLFHSIFSDASLSKRPLSLKQLTSGFQLCQHELRHNFQVDTQDIRVSEHIQRDADSWYSVYEFFKYADGNEAPASKTKIVKAMPILSTKYKCHTVGTRLRFTSIEHRNTREGMVGIHKRNGIKLINYGGHYVQTDGQKIYYNWPSINRCFLLPTLTSTLLLSFGLSSICRYRPALLNSVLNSPLNLIFDVFTSEADSVFIPAIRNFLYREEMVIGQNPFM